MHAVQVKTLLLQIMAELKLIANPSVALTWSSLVGVRGHHWMANVTTLCRLAQLRAWRQPGSAFSDIILREVTKQEHRK